MSLERAACWYRWYRLTWMVRAVTGLPLSDSTLAHATVLFRPLFVRPVEPGSAEFEL